MVEPVDFAVGLFAAGFVRGIGFCPATLSGATEITRETTAKVESRRLMIVLLLNPGLWYPGLASVSTCLTFAVNILAGREMSL
jgi:hypothetical protein